MSRSFDPDLLSRLLESRVRFRPRDVEEMVWEAIFEGHLVTVVLADEVGGGPVLVVDGEPSGELSGWPAGWRRT